MSETLTLETEDGHVVMSVPGALQDDQDGQAPPQRAAPQPDPAGPAPPRKRRGRPPGKPDQARVTRSPAVTLDDKQRAEGVKGIAQIGAGLMLLASKATAKDPVRSDAFKADAVTIAGQGEPLADACVQLAHSDPKFAAALDKVCSAGPYAALITIAVGIGSQVTRNHKPDLKIPGTVHPDELLATLVEEKADV